MESDKYITIVPVEYPRNRQQFIRPPDEYRYNIPMINLLLCWYFNMYCIYISDFPQNRNWPHTRAVRTESGTMRRKELKRSLDHKRSHNHCHTDPIQLCSKPIISAPLAFQTTPKAKKKRLYCYKTIIYWSYYVMEFRSL